MILEQIAAYKEQEVKELLASTNLPELKAQVASLAPTRDFRKALRQRGRVEVIAEIKRKSPSKGLLCPDFDHLKLARLYRDNGAATVSVLTDEKFFGGALAYLTQVRQEIELPLLRKDFIIHPVQLYQSRLAGADAVLLIAALLPGQELAMLFSLAREIGLQVLVEVHDEVELARAMAMRAEIIGINNRNLHTFETNLATTGRLLAAVNLKDTTIVSESGISTKEHLDYLRQFAINAVLVGESLVTAPDTGGKLLELVEGGGAIAS